MFFVRHRKICLPTLRGCNGADGTYNFLVYLFLDGISRCQSSPWTKNVNSLLTIHLQNEMKNSVNVFYFAFFLFWKREPGLNSWLDSRLLMHIWLFVSVCWILSLTHNSHQTEKRMLLAIQITARRQSRLRKTKNDIFQFQCEHNSQFTIHTDSKQNPKKKRITNKTKTSSHDEWKRNK